jgi:stage III sporulation protein AF
MLDNISTWIKQVILVVIFTVFVDFVIPNNRFLKYAKVLLGLIVMVAIITPALTFINKEDTLLLKEVFIKNNDVFKGELNDQSKKLGEKNDELMVKQYKKNINAFIHQQVNAIGGYEVKDILAVIEEDSGKETFGKINEIHLVLRKKPKDFVITTAPQTISVKVNSIRGEDSRDKSHIIENYDEQIREIKKNLMLQLGILETKIHINVEG